MKAIGAVERSDRTSVGSVVSTVYKSGAEMVSQKVYTGENLTFGSHLTHFKYDR